LSKECNETKEKAHLELKQLQDLYKATVIDAVDPKAKNIEKQKLKLKAEFVGKLKESEDLIGNMNKYLCFSLENKRFFNVSF
jgi:hypothetical protein